MKIGMNAFVDIILESKENVFSVPFDSVVAKKGQSSIYIVDDSNKVVEIPVTTGIETATSMEIAGDGLQEGMKVVIKPSLVTVGQTITPSANNLPAGTRSTNGSGTRQSGGTGQGTTGQAETGKVEPGRADQGHPAARASLAEQHLRSSNQLIIMAINESRQDGVT